LPIPYRAAIDLVDQHAEPSSGTVCNVSCTIASTTSSPSTTGRSRPPGCAPPQRFPPRRTGYATDGQTSAWTRTDERSRRSRHRPWPTTTPWPGAPPEPARCANERAPAAQPAVHPSSPKPQPQPPPHPHSNRSLCKRHTTTACADRHAATRRADVGPHRPQALRSSSLPASGVPTIRRTTLAAPAKHRSGWRVAAPRFGEECRRGRSSPHIQYACRPETRVVNPS
jgi:hypothetical protein